MYSSPKNIVQIKQCVSENNNENILKRNRKFHPKVFVFIFVQQASYRRMVNPREPSGPAGNLRTLLLLLPPLPPPPAAAAPPGYGPM